MTQPTDPNQPNRPDSLATTQTTNRTQGILASLVAGILFVIGVLVYALTGVDLFGVNTVNVTPPVPTIIATDQVPVDNDLVYSVPLGQGFGYGKGFWQVYFTAPSGERNRALWTNGIDAPLASAINNAQFTIDIAAFELNNEVITQAILNAHQRGVRVRIVTDDEHGLEDDDSTLVELELVDIPIVDDDRSALMHDKFVIIDGITVWLGSMNYTMNGVYRNNNNLLQLRSRRLVQSYQDEFDEMFTRRAFGPTSPVGNSGTFTVSGVPLAVYFASEDDVMDHILREVFKAQSQIRFMAFSFTRDDLGRALVARANSGVVVEGIFETTGSSTQYSEMKRLICANIPVMRDGNNGILHHKVIIIDDTTVITGSFNFSNNAVRNNDENLLIMRDPDLAALFIEEYNRLRAIAKTPDVDCEG
ncbi:MAG: hypothetical protein CL607_09040 [Anaerolineaceae bacterium]|nr:hypothetical protein [Anaerolineaceae bacterium]